MGIAGADRIIVGMLALLACVSCGNNQKKTTGEKPLAAVGDKNLYFSDIKSDHLQKMQKGDSLAELKAYVDKWVEKQLIVTEAEKTLSDAEKDKSDLIEEYKNSLLLYEYEKKLISQKLDTAVTFAEIETYYNNNQATFELKKNIVKIRYIKIDKKKADLKKLKPLMQNPSPLNDSLLKLYAEKNADNFYVDNNWLYLDDIVKEIPLDADYDQERFLNNNKFIDIEENGMLYLLFIADFKVKNSASPLEFEKHKIRDIILYQRKLNLIQSNQDKLLEDAVKNGRVKYYIN